MSEKINNKKVELEELNDVSGGNNQSPLPKPPLPKLYRCDLTEQKTPAENNNPIGGETPTPENREISKSIPHYWQDPLDL